MSRNSAHSVERPASRHISADENEIERLDQVHSLEVIEDLFQPIVAAWAASPTFDPETITLAHHVGVGKMGDPPPAVVRGRRSRIRERRVAAACSRVSEAPHERGDCQVDRDDHDGIGERGDDEALQDKSVCNRAHPAAGRPDQEGDRNRDDAHDSAGRRRTRRAQSRQLDALKWLPKLICHMTERFPAKRVAQLNSQRVQ